MRKIKITKASGAPCRAALVQRNRTPVPQLTQREMAELRPESDVIFDSFGFARKVRTRQAQIVGLCTAPETNRKYLVWTERGTLKTKMAQASDHLLAQL